MSSIYKLLFWGVLGLISIFLFWSNVSADLTDCSWFGANFEDCWVWDIGVIWTNEADDTEDRLIDTIKNFINRILGMLALIVLLLLLRGWFQMVTAAGDDGKYKNWFKILKQAAFGLAFIWLSWLMVSLIFWIIDLATTDSSWWWAQTTMIQYIHTSIV